MNLKDFLANREKPPELYWSLVLEPGWVQAGIWYIGDSVAEVISVSPPAAWETEDELTGAADAALSSAVAKLPEDYQEPSKTVFGVPAAWVQGGEISDEYLAKIKGLCTDLSLNPVGFVVLPEAIAHLYKSEEGSPLSAIVLGLGKEFLEISVFKLGNLAGTTQVSRSVSLIEDVTEGLSRFEGVAPLPSRFVVYDGKGAELNEAKEALMQETWQDLPKVKFLHTPKAEILVSDRKVLATSLAGANEIGQVSQVASKEISAQDPSILPEGEPDADVLQNVAPAENSMAPEDMGFAVGTDVTEDQKTVELPKQVEFQRPVTREPEEPSKPQMQVGGYLQKTKNLLHRLSGSLFSGTILPKSSGLPRLKGKPIAIFGIALAALVILGGIYWWFFPKAKIAIYVTPKSFSEEVDISFSTDGQTDLGGGIVPAQEISIDVTGDKTKSATGSKTIGDKAKGSVQVQNGTAFPINLAAGTILVSSGNLKFSLDNAASVSAALSPNSPGTANLSVTADSIGAEHNLAKDEVFKVGNYPKAEVDAVAVADFSGGSSQQISAVSDDDRVTLENQLKDELSQNARGQLQERVTEDQIFIDELAGLDVTTENFDHKVGDQADSLKLNLTLTATAIAADRAKLLEYARNVLRDKIPSGFVLRDSQITFKFTFDSKQEEIINYKVEIGANFLPQVQVDDIVKKVVGRTPAVTETYLSSVPGFSRAEVTLSPKLPGFFGTLPHLGKNIQIEIVAER
jgi:hypothetical protein